MPCAMLLCAMQIVHGTHVPTPAAPPLCVGAGRGTWPGRPPSIRPGAPQTTETPPVQAGGSYAQNTPGIQLQKGSLPGANTSSSPSADVTQSHPRESHKHERDPRGRLRALRSPKADSDGSASSANHPAAAPASLNLIGSCVNEGNSEPNKGLMVSLDMEKASDRVSYGYWPTPSQAARASPPRGKNSPSK